MCARSGVSFQGVLSCPEHGRRSLGLADSAAIPHRAADRHGPEAFEVATLGLSAAEREAVEIGHLCQKAAALATVSPGRRPLCHWQSVNPVLAGCGRATLGAEQGEARPGCRSAL